MNIPFSAYCVFAIVLAVFAVMGISPLLWDAAGYLNDILNTVYHVEFSVVKP